MPVTSVDLEQRVATLEAELAKLKAEPGIPHDDDDLERLLLERSPRFQAMLNRSRQRSAGRVVSGTS